MSKNWGIWIAYAIGGVALIMGAKAIEAPTWAASAVLGVTGVLLWNYTRKEGA